MTTFVLLFEFETVSPPSFALACCIVVGTTTSPVDSIAKIPTISNVGFQCLLIDYRSSGIFI